MGETIFCNYHEQRDSLSTNIPLHSSSTFLYAITFILSQDIAKHVFSGGHNDIGTNTKIVFSNPQYLRVSKMYIYIKISPDNLTKVYF